MEVADELELLTSVYENQVVTNTDGKTYTAAFSILATAGPGEGICSANFALNGVADEYPARPPDVSITGIRAMTVDQETALRAAIISAGADAEGEPCLYQMAEAAREFLDDCPGAACSVCLEALATGQAAAQGAIALSPCGHGFHRACIGEWFTMRQRDLLRRIARGSSLREASARSRAAVLELAHAEQNLEDASAALAKHRNREAQLQALLSESSDVAASVRPKLAAVERAISAGVAMKKRRGKQCDTARAAAEEAASKLAVAEAEVEFAHACPVCRSTVSRPTIAELVPPELLDVSSEAARGEMERGGAAAGWGRITDGGTAEIVVPDALRREGHAALREVAAADPALGAALQRRSAAAAAGIRRQQAVLDAEREAEEAAAAAAVAAAAGEGSGETSASGAAGGRGAGGQKRSGGAGRRRTGRRR